MKALFGFVCTALSGVVFAGAMGDVATSDVHFNEFASISGGYYNSNYQSNFTNYRSGVLFSKASFNDVNSSGYGQFALGRASRFGSFAFDQQVVLGKLGQAEQFTTTSSNWSFRQNLDFGYDFMPKLSVFHQLDAYGILGAHYARFVYQKIPFGEFSATTSSFNLHSDQIGLNLGAGLNFHVNRNVLLGIKYQHWQYASVMVNGQDLMMSNLITENIMPSFNLAGVELRYYWG